MTWVYVVEMSGWEWCRIEGIFSTRELADQCVARLRAEMADPDSDYGENTTWLSLKRIQVDTHVVEKLA